MARSVGLEVLPGGKGDRDHAPGSLWFGSASANLGKTGAALSRRALPQRTVQWRDPTAVPLCSHPCRPRALGPGPLADGPAGVAQCENASRQFNSQTQVSIRSNPWRVDTAGSPRLGRNCSDATSGPDEGNGHREEAERANVG